MGGSYSDSKRAAYFHTTTFSAGTYFALPLGTLQSTVVVLRGVGIRRTTLVAESLLLKLVLTVTTYDTCVVPISFTVGIIRSGSFTFEVDLYLRKSIICCKATYVVHHSEGLTSLAQIHHPEE